MIIHEPLHYASMYCIQVRATLLKVLPVCATYLFIYQFLLWFQTPPVALSHPGKHLTASAQLTAHLRRPMKTFILA